MSAPVSVVLEVTPRGHGSVLDIGGGQGGLRPHLERLGYRYVNLDIQRYENGQPLVIGDAHALPFGDESFDVVICKDALTCFHHPAAAVEEVSRVLKPDGLFVVLAGFLTPITPPVDYYRFTPLALHSLLRNFEIQSTDSPLSVFWMLGTLSIEMLKKLRLGFAAVPIRRACYRLDRVLHQVQKRPSSFAASYRVVARRKT